MKIVIDAQSLGVRSPYDEVCIRWEGDGQSGSTELEAWAVQHELDELQAAGYTIIGIERV